MSTSKKLMGKADEIRHQEKVDELKKLIAESENEINQLILSGKTEDAINLILINEKKARLLNEYDITFDQCLKILTIYKDTREWKKLGEIVKFLSLRRSQHRSVISRMIDNVMTMFDLITDPNQYVDFLETLRSITEGSIYVELQCARITVKLSQFYEQKLDQRNKAAEILEQLHVETISAMDVREKANILLDQLRLRLATDMVRARIIAKKLQPKDFEDQSIQDLKISYYQLLIQYYIHENDLRQLYLCFTNLCNIPAIQENQQLNYLYFKQRIISLLLNEINPEQIDILRVIKANDKKLLKLLPDYLKLVDLFLTQELVEFTDNQRYMMYQLPLFTENQSIDRVNEWKTLLNYRLVQHNIRVVSQVYTQIYISRMSELLKKTNEETEQYLNEMIVNGDIYGRIDRPKGIITFVKKQNTNSILSNWSQGVDQVLRLVEETGHLIEKENVLPEV